MDFLKNFLKNTDRKKLANYSMIFFAGLILLIIGSNSMFSKSKNASSNEIKKNSLQVLDDNKKANNIENNLNEMSYEKTLEKRLEDILSQADGVGDVKVMLTLSYGKEIVIARDKTNDEATTNEADSNGGKRMSNTASTTDRTITVKDESGNEVPIILKEVEPIVLGVVIIAQGGDNPFVKDNLTRTASALLGLELYKVEVLKMKK